MKIAMHPDLFGGETPIIENHHGQYKKFRLVHRYRKATEKMNCSNCSHSFMSEGNSKKYRKCDYMGNTCSVATDVSRNCVCNLHEDDNGSA